MQDQSTMFSPDKNQSFMPEATIMMSSEKNRSPFARSPLKQQIPSRSQQPGMALRDISNANSTIPRSPFALRDISNAGVAAVRSPKTPLPCPPFGSSNNTPARTPMNYSSLNKTPRMVATPLDLPKKSLFPFLSTLDEENASLASGFEDDDVVSALTVSTDESPTTSLDGSVPKDPGGSLFGNFLDRASFLSPRNRSIASRRPMTETKTRTTLLPDRKLKPDLSSVQLDISNRIILSQKEEIAKLKVKLKETEQKFSKLIQQKENENNALRSETKRLTSEIEELRNVNKILHEQAAAGDKAAKEIKVLKEEMAALQSEVNSMRSAANSVARESRNRSVGEDSSCTKSFDISHVVHDRMISSEEVSLLGVASAVDEESQVEQQVLQTKCAEQNARSLLDDAPRKRKDKNLGKTVWVKVGATLHDATVVLDDSSRDFVLVKWNINGIKEMVQRKDISELPPRSRRKTKCFSPLLQKSKSSKADCNAKTSSSETSDNCMATPAEHQGIAVVDKKESSHKMPALSSRAMSDKVVAAANSKTLTPLSSSKGCSKPLLSEGEEVYAAWWPTKKRKGKHSWHPAVITSYKEPSSECSKYGPTRFYDVTFNDGEKSEQIEDIFVMRKSEYNLTIRFMGSGWKGVWIMKDAKSKDRWAKVIGWYVAEIDGTEHHFTYLSDALKAYDSYVVRCKGAGTQECDLNLPEEWSFGDDAPVPINQESRYFETE